MAPQRPYLLARWPLLVIGLLIIGGATLLADPTDREGIRALLLGLGCVVIGAGLVLVVWGRDHELSHWHEEPFPPRAPAPYTPPDLEPPPSDDNPNDDFDKLA